jgi:phospholipid/cholesterol/gamma-HCH transport system substrate-binding protein
MDSSRAEVKVGATVLAALIILIAGLIWLKGFRIERSRYRQDVWFPNIGTLASGDPVSISGVTKGKVAAVTLDSGGVRVTLWLANEVALRRDASFTIKNVGLMGELFVDVQTGVDPGFMPRDSVPRGEYDTGIPEVMGMMGRMTADIRDLVHAVRSTIGADTTLARLSMIAANLEQISRQTAAMVERNQGGIDGAVTDLSEAARRLRTTVEANEGAVTRAVQRADSASARILTFADRLDSLSTGVQEVVSDLRTGEGTLPRLIHDDQLLKRWEETVTEIDALVADIRANPQKYLKVKVSLF